MKYGLSDTQFDEIVEIIGSYPEIEEAILFGSRAIGSYKEASDVDIALKGENVTAALAAKLKFDIEEDTYLPFFFDFVAYPTITSESLREHIEQKGVSIYRAGWRECRLDEVYDFSSGISKNREEFGFGFGFLSFKNVFQNFFVPIELTELVNSTEKERLHHSIKRGDVFLTRTSETQDELGMSCVALKDYPDATFNGFTKRLRPKNKKIILPEYAGFYFRSPRFRALVTSMASITTRASLNNGMLADLIIVVPPLPEQHAISSVLSSLDDKIDLLHRQNKTLEAMAETLFRQWFVEEAGEDWEEGKVEDLLILQRGFDLPSQNRIDGPYPIYAASGYSGGHAEYKVKGPGVTTGRSGLLGKVFFVLDDFWPLNTSLYIKEFKRAEPLFAYFFLKTLDLESYNAGSAVPTLNRNHVHEESVLIPPPDLVAHFEQTALPFYLKIKQNKLQVTRLENLRDTLLPKLMSGEVRVEL